MVVDRPVIGAKGKRRRSKAKAAVLLLVLAAALLYAKTGGIDLPAGLLDLAGEVEFTDLSEFLRSRAPLVREAALGLSETISGLIRG
jgi:hypothetical protein